VQEFIVGRPLDDLAPEQLTPSLLAEVWQQVGLLRSARIAHHDLVASSVLVDGEGRAWIVDFGNAVNGATDDQLGRDVAELMASLALRLEPRTVVESAVAGLGRDAVAAALPGLEPLGLSRATRTGLRAMRPRLGALRREVRDALDLAHVDRPSVSPAGPVARVLVAVGAAAVIVGVPMLAGATAVVASVETGGWRWLGGALAIAVLARTTMALAAMATTDRRLAIGRVFGASMVADGASLIRGRSGWRTAALRFLQRSGVPPGAAERAADRFLAGSAVAAVIVAVATLGMALFQGDLGTWQAPAALVPSVALGLGAWALVLVGRFLAGREPDAPRGGGSMAAVGRALARDERDGGGLERWAAVAGWSALGIALEAATLASAVHAVGSGLSLLSTVTVYAVLHMVWTLVPVTAVPGAADVALLLTLTAMGAPLSGACAAVLVFRLLTFWFPAAVGSLLVPRLERRLLL
jgi:undecaprenyl-diphosphatase